ncbi:MAG: M23 family metallopeptidase [Chitinispirillia bacterium]|nr:M23 family metallopeptidase [Chitinispirillia bacterium]
MIKHRWNVVLADSRNSKGARSVRIPRFITMFCILAALVGVAGFARVVYLASSYGIAVLGVSEQRRENRNLRQKIENLERFVQGEKETITRIVNYEDNARLKYGMEAIDSEVRLAGVGGLPSQEDMLFASMLDPVIVRAESLRLQTAALLRQAELQESTFLQTSENVKRMHSRWSKRPSIWPAHGRITSEYGFRFHPFTGLRLMHEGLDIANEVWTPIYATADGQVQNVSNWTHFGNLVKISHLNGEYITYYAHLHKAAVTPGQFVKRGELIGYMGNSGRSTGPHLHYEVHHKGRPINPMAFILPADHIVD